MSYSALIEARTAAEKNAAILREAARISEQRRTGQSEGSQSASK